MYPIEEQLWHSHRTILVLGDVTRVAWWPPFPEQDLPGVMVAPGLEAAQQFMEQNPMSRC